MKQEEWFKSKKFKESRIENAKKGNLKLHELAVKREKEYLKNPKLCKVCQNPLPYKEHNSKIFCSSSCAAKFNNANRIFEPSKDKRVKILKCFNCGKEVKVNIRVAPINAYCENCKGVNKTKKAKRRMLRQKIYKKSHYKEFQKICVYCGKNFISKKKTTQYCSGFCSAKHGLKIGTRKPWQSRNIKSYPERFFERVLNNNNLIYEMNKPFKTYFLDFYFKDKNIDLEIDGKQHTYTDRTASDLVRDKILTENGIKVYRIKWNSINTEDGKNEIKTKIQNFLNFYKNA